MVEPAVASKLTLPRRGADKHRLYELAVQDVDFDVEFAFAQYERRRSRPPRILREDFCGSALMACRWVEQHPECRAIGLELDREVLDWAQSHNVAALGPLADRVDLRLADVRSVTRPKADVIQAFNFSYYLFDTWPALVEYFTSVRRSLAPGGIIMLDAYGGWVSQQQKLQERRTVRSPGGTFEYIWDQATFNPIDNRALGHIHFGFKDGKRWSKAFSFEWRVYSPAEVSDALGAAGFVNVEVLWDWAESDDYSDFRPTRNAENSPGWWTYIIAERPSR
jgi:SAM-dependent methyltransferase